MKRLIITVLLLAVCLPVYAEKQWIKVHHSDIDALMTRVTALETTVATLTDQSAKVAALEQEVAALRTEVNQLKDDITHIEVASVTLDMPLEVWFAEGPTKEWMTARKVLVEDFRGTVRVTGVMRIDFEQDVLTGVKYLDVTDAMGEKHKISSGDFRYAIAFGR